MLKVTCVNNIEYDLNKFNGVKDVCLVSRDRDTVVYGYQIMVRSGSGFYHVYPCRVFDLNTAQAICKEFGYNVLAIGSSYKCL